MRYFCCRFENEGGEIRSAQKNKQYINAKIKYRNYNSGEYAQKNPPYA